MPVRQAGTTVLAGLLCAALVTAMAAPASAASGAGRAGALSSHRHLRYDSGQVVRWNPCDPIRYRVNLAGAPAGALRDVQIAVRKVSYATGIRFQYEGGSQVVPDRSYGSQVQPGSPPPLVIAWAAPGQGPGRSNAVAPHQVAYSWTSGLSWSDPSGARHPMRAVTGAVVVNAQHSLRPGFRTYPSRGITLMHELGHVMGLDHVSDRRQIMYTRILDHPPTWGAGDFRGLRLVGRPAGCMA